MFPTDADVDIGNQLLLGLFSSAYTIRFLQGVLHDRNSGMSSFRLRSPSHPTYPDLVLFQRRPEPHQQYDFCSPVIFLTAVTAMTSFISLTMVIGVEPSPSSSHITSGAGFQ